MIGVVFQCTDVCVCVFVECVYGPYFLYHEVRTCAGKSVIPLRVWYKAFSTRVPVLIGPQE